MGNMEYQGQPMPNQQAGYQPTQPQQQQYNYQTQGPNLGSVTSNPMGKMGLILIILSIIGLIISFAAPWGFVDADGLDENMFGHNLENEDEISLCALLVGVSGETAVNKYCDHVTGTPGMADMGFVFLLIIGAIMIFFGMMKSNPMMQRWSSITMIGLGLIALIPSLWVLLAGIRFICYHIFMLMSGNRFEDIGVFFPAAYIIFILGLIIFVMVFRMMKSNIISKGGGM